MPQAAWEPDDTVTNWLMSGLCLAAAVLVPWFAPITWVVDPASPDFDPLVIIPVLAAALSVYFLVIAARATSRRRRFGGSFLELEGEYATTQAGAFRSGSEDDDDADDDAADDADDDADDGSDDDEGHYARMGQPLRGRIRTSTPLQPSGDYRVALQCVDIRRFRKRGSRPYEEEFVVWEQVMTVPAAGVDSVRGIPFSFQVPSSVGEDAKPKRTGGLQTRAALAVTIPGTKARIFTHNSPPEARRWRIAVSAPMPGVDFAAWFLVQMR